MGAEGIKGKIYLLFNYNQLLINPSPKAIAPYAHATEAKKRELAILNKQQLLKLSPIVPLFITLEEHYVR